MTSLFPSSVTASQAGSLFVPQYYQMLRQQPELVHQFYAISSTMIRYDGDSKVIASSLFEIDTLVQSLQFTGIEIKTINSVESWSKVGEGIDVAVSGSVKSDCFSGWRKFVQTFFLASQEEDEEYVVIKDVFHFVSERDLSGVIHTKHPSEVHNIKREDSETVEDFLFRFTKETSQIPGADDMLKISGFIHGVCNNQLVEILYENYPQTVKYMIDRVKGFVSGQKAMAFLKDADTQKPAYSRRPNNQKRNTFSPYRPARKVDSLKSWMEQPITFPAIRTDDHQEGPFVITALIGGFHVHRIHVNGGSASNIMFESCFMQLDEEICRNLNKDPCPTVRFSGEVLNPLGQIQLPVTIGNGGRSRTLEMTFSVVRARSSPNIVIGRPGIQALGAVVSTIHGAMKFPTPSGITTILSKAEKSIWGERID